MYEAHPPEIMHYPPFAPKGSQSMKTDQAKFQALCKQQRKNRAALPPAQKRLIKALAQAEAEMPAFSQARQAMRKESKENPYSKKFRAADTHYQTLRAEVEKVFPELKEARIEYAHLQAIRRSLKKRIKALAAKIEKGKAK